MVEGPGEGVGGGFEAGDHEDDCFHDDFVVGEGLAVFLGAGDEDVEWGRGVRHFCWLNEVTQMSCRDMSVRS